MNSFTKMIATVVGGAVLTLASYLFLLNPALERVSMLSAEEELTRAEIQRLDQQILAFKSAQSDLSKATSKDLVYDAVVDDKRLYLPIEAIESAAQATNSEHTLKILKDSIDAPPQRNAPEKKVTQQTELAEVPFVLSVSNGSFINLVQFLQYLERNPYFLEASEVDMIMQLGGAGEPAVLNATIEGVFLVKKNQTNDQP